MTEIRFADTTIRDGHLSLWAQNMRTGMMLAIARDLDRAGFTSIECMYTHPKKAVRELKEDPWERIRLLRERITETPLRTIIGRFPQFDLSPPFLLEMRLRCEARAGIRQARISDEWNQADMWAWKIRAAREVGIDPVVNLIYSHSPKHTDAYYAERAAQLAALRPFRICLKDPGGLLTPERLRTLVPAVLAETGDIPVELHAHCTTGLGPLNALEAVTLGIRTVNTGVPPLANGTALPSVFNVAANLRALGYTPVFDEAAARAASRTLTAIAAHDGLPMGEPVEPDVAQYQHQVPGGMLTNLRHQLKLVGMEDRYADTLAECARVREEWGWPIMVTPLSQFVGSQAAINVITGERYREVTDQTVLYALGYWGGDEAIQGMDPDVRDRILARPRAREIVANPPREPTPEEIRARFGGPGVSEEEMLLRMECSDAELAALRAAGPPRRYEQLDAESPLVGLVAQLTRRADRQYIHVQKGGLALTLARGAAEQA
ncbi:MAG TPA: biotin carboxyl carrier protein [Chloroflexota bacterium]|nr:biotin carboxyl carrier protein [Chloroflexota bacterium]